MLLLSLIDLAPVRTMLALVDRCKRGAPMEPPSGKCIRGLGRFDAPAGATSSPIDQISC